MNDIKNLFKSIWAFIKRNKKKILQIIEILIPDESIIYT